MPPVAFQTAQDLLRFREPGKTAELVRGMLIVREPPGTGNGARAERLTLRVGAFVERHDLGQVFAQDTGFKIERDPDTVREPDVAFVAREAGAHPGRRLRRARARLGGRDPLPQRPAR